MNYIENLADLFLKRNKEDTTPVLIRLSPFFGGKSTHDSFTFPQKSIFENRRKVEFKDLMLTKLEWSVDTYIDSLCFTMSNGQVSPKYGKSAFTNSCYFSAPITRVVATYRERGLVSLEISTKSEDLTI